MNHSGASDVVVAKLAPDGRSFVYCGFIGGDKWEYAEGIAIDKSGCAYIVGKGTGGAGYPYKNGPPYTGPHFAFVTKINAAGTDLVYSGFIGGQHPVHPTGIAVDAQGAAYVCGYTDKPETLPLKGGPDITPNGSYDGWVGKLQPDGRAFEYFGLIGGASLDYPLGIAVDGQGRAYLGGFTYSDESTFPVSVGPNLTYYKDNLPLPLTGDAFVARVNAAGTGLDYCGYIGGYAIDTVEAIAVDASGAAYVTGSTLATETTFPVKVGPSLVFGGGVRDAFVGKVDPTGRSLVYLGFLGGNGGDVARAITVDADGAAWVAGHTSSGATFPVRVGPTPHIAPGGVFLTKVSPSGASLEASGTVGANGSTVRGIGLDGTGNAYVAGYTYDDERTFPVKVGPDLTFNDNSRYCPCGDGFVMKFVTTRLNLSGTTRPGDTVLLTLLASDDATRPYQLASSFGTGPIAIDTRAFGLSLDALLWISTSELVRGTFIDYRGTIGANGRATARLALPAIPAIIGTKVHSAFVTLDPAAPSGVRSISDTESFTIVSP